jgi:hypothetical protein
MDTTIKTLIEANNDSDLIAEFTTIIMDFLPVIIPVVGAFAVTFFAVVIIRRLLRV